MNIDEMNINTLVRHINVQTFNCCNNKNVYYRKDGLNNHTIECINCKAIETHKYFYDMIMNWNINWNKQSNIRELECQELLSRR